MLLCVMCFYWELYSLVDINMNIRLTASIKQNAGINLYQKSLVLN